MPGTLGTLFFGLRPTSTPKASINDRYKLDNKGAGNKQVLQSQRMQQDKIQRTRQSFNRGKICKIRIDFHEFSLTKKKLHLQV